VSFILLAIFIIEGLCFFVFEYKAFERGVQVVLSKVSSI